MYNLSKLVCVLISLMMGFVEFGNCCNSAEGYERMSASDSTGSHDGLDINKCDLHSFLKDKGIEEVEVQFQCKCHPDYKENNCHLADRMFSDEAFFMVMQTDDSNEYDISFRFRTSMPNGILAVGQGFYFYCLELAEGRLNLHSCLESKWDGVFLGSNFSDDRWHHVRVSFTSKHLHLAVNQQEGVFYPITPAKSSFEMTVLGGSTPHLRRLIHGLPYFVGCIKNVMVNGRPFMATGPVVARTVRKPIHSLVPILPKYHETDVLVFVIVLCIVAAPLGLIKLVCAICKLLTTDWELAIQCECGRPLNKEWIRSQTMNNGKKQSRPKQVLFHLLLFYFFVIFLIFK